MELKIPVILEQRRTRGLRGRKGETVSVQCGKELHLEVEPSRILGEGEAGCYKSPVLS